MELKFKSHPIYVIAKDNKDVILALMDHGYYKDSLQFDDMDCYSYKED